MAHLQKTLLLLPLAVALGCAHPAQRNDWSAYTGPGAQYFQQEEFEFPDIPDPLEAVNRSVGRFNRAFLLYAADPLTTAWRRIVPQPVRNSLAKVIANLGYPPRLVSNLLQAKWNGAARETGRFLVNSTFGLGGLFDPARSRVGWLPSNEDLGQTFATWGWRESTFLSLPLLGPSTIRDGAGTALEMPLNPLFYFFPAGPAATFISGSEKVDDIKRMIETHQDPYFLVRYVWVLSRRILNQDLEFTAEPSAAAETLETLFLSFEDPWFPRRGHRRSVEIPTTGRELRYDVWLQRENAPIVFILPGLGGHREAKSSVAVAEMAWRKGFSAVTISSALNFDFMESAATTDIPGFAPADAHDVHVALDAIWRDLDASYQGRIGARALMGISMGAFHTLFIAAAENEPDQELVSFDRYLALYPPVRLEQGMRKLDAYYNVPLQRPEEEREEWATAVLQKAIALGGDFDLEPGNPIPLTTEEAEFLIGLAFRLTLHDMIWVSQTRNDMGVLQTPRTSLRRAAASREILEFSFLEYLHAFALPYYRERGEAQSVDELFSHSTLHSIADLLARNQKIRVFANQNDFLITGDDAEWLTQLLGAERVTFYPTGGHMGNLHLPEVQDDVMNALSDLH